MRCGYKPPPRRCGTKAPTTRRVPTATMTLAVNVGTPDGDAWKLKLSRDGEMIFQAFYRDDDDWSAFRDAMARAITLVVEAHDASGEGMRR